MATELSAEDYGHPVVAEVAQLLDQCTAEELASILSAIEGSEGGENMEQFVGELPLLPEVEPLPMEAQSNFTPVPPAAPPSGARRPVPSGVGKRTEADPAGDESPLTKGDLVAILAQQNSMVLTEVRKMLPQQPQPVGASTFSASGEESEGVGMETLTKVLVERDLEVKELEGKLSQLEGVLSEKDQRVAQLGNELERTLREVRHRQLDLEFQQLKLEEQVRNNGELEQGRRMLTMQVEGADLNSKHAALDVELCRNQTPRSVQLQGSLPWTLRKNRLF